MGIGWRPESQWSAEILYIGRELRTQSSLTGGVHGPTLDHHGVPTEVGDRPRGSHTATEADTRGQKGVRR